ncbi:MAG: hypothetical protein AOA66_1166 [Candidatus Bathyarchaeota archaeon BA2]|nr:MAG: hypothetical protein AOA66_1166 [Candidatus Bathyarchaeota archaeon BA2]
MGKPTAVSNSGPLIWLGRYGLLFLLRKHFSLIAIPTAVYVEVVKEGLKHNYLDAQETKNAVDEGWINLKTVDERDIETVARAEEKLGIRLGMGERQAISLARHLKVKIILTDDEDAAHVSRVLRLKPGAHYIFCLRPLETKSLQRIKS